LGNHAYFGANQHFIFNDYPTDIEEGTVVINKHVFTDTGKYPQIDVEWS
jgi:hypothetical protein